MTGAELHYRDGNREFHVHCKTDVEPDTSDQVTPENGTVLRGDLGVNTLAVTSTGTFWMGNEFDHWRQEYEKRRGSLQQCSTRWANKNIQSVGRKVEGRHKRMRCSINNELVAEARENGRPVIAFEDLIDIRERTGGSWDHTWAFDRFYEYVKHKAEEHGITVEQIESENTSRRCLPCGFTHPDPR